MTSQKPILIAVLNWGLGHASRCIPIIKELCKLNKKVIIGSDGRALLLLKKEFPALTFVTLPSYQITYPTRYMALNMIIQGPSILNAIYREYNYLKKIVATYNIGGILSDNRFGCWHASIPSVFISHQINIAIPKSNWLERLVNYWNHQFIQRYTSCWIPDMPGELALASRLSDRSTIKNGKYIGLLSRMKALNKIYEYDIIVVLSGPEPQRTKLQAILIHQLRALPVSVLLVAGKTEDTSSYRDNNIEVVPYLTSYTLNEAIAKSKYVICRSGYSSIMDLACMGKQALLIPTPGQTEQELLAKQLHQANICPMQNQSEIDLKKGLEEMDNYSGFDASIYNNDIFSPILKDWLADL